MSGAAIITLAASSLTLKALIIAKMRENPSNATADEQSSFSVNSTSLHLIQLQSASHEEQWRLAIKWENTQPDSPIISNILSET